MNIENLIQLLSVLKDENNSSQKHEAIGKKCVVRSYASGVHYGTVENVNENGGRSRVTLKRSRRIWSWKGAFSLSELSQKGIDSQESRISCIVPICYIEDVIELIPLSSEALEKLNETKDYEC